MKILFVVPYAPNLVRVRPYQLIRSLVAGGHQVILGTLMSDAKELTDIDEIRKICHQVTAYQLPRMRSLLNCLFALPTKKPLQYVYCWEPKFVKGLEEIVLQNAETIDVIHVEHLRGAIYGEVLKSFLLQRKLRIPILWDSVDSISHLFRQSAQQSRQLSKRWLTSFELARTEKYEHHLANKFEHVLVTSAVDRDAFLSLSNETEPVAKEHISILPNGVDLEYFQPPNGISREPATLVVSGKMSYHANISMALYLVKEIMPLVWEKRPEVKLWIVGKDPNREISKLAENPLVTVTGTVPDLRNYLQRATVAVAPIVYGAGIQNKVLEAMACATPVVTSPQALTALEAVSGRDLEQARTPGEYADKVLKLLASPSYRQKIGEAGRSYVETHHRWSIITEKLTTIYRNVNH